MGKMVSLTIQAIVGPAKLATDDAGAAQQSLKLQLTH
jgi:hypothetical protein